MIVITRRKSVLVVSGHLINNLCLVIILPTVATVEVLRLQQEQGEVNLAQTHLSILSEAAIGGKKEEEDRVGISCVRKLSFNGVIIVCLVRVASLLFTILLSNG